MKNLVIILCCGFVFSSCNGQQNKNIDVKKDENEKNMKDILKRQLQYGIPNYSNPYEYSSSDFKVIMPITKEELKAYGFKFPNDDEFNSRIKVIFDRIIDLKSNSNYIYVNFLDKCNRTAIYFPNNIYAYFGVFVIKQDKYISESYAIPQIIDYQKKFLDISMYENSLPKKSMFENREEVTRYLWKDDKRLNEELKKNIQTLVARNMYLFNDSRSYFKWLILNDEYFMQSLVTTFGYYDDKELLKWVVENTKFDSNNPAELDKLFWNKKCNGTVKLNLAIFPILKEIITPEETQYLEALKEYVMYLLEDKEKRNELSIADRSKLLAHLVYFGEQYRYDENYNDQSFFMQRISLFVLDGSIEKEIERNNFYNLPNYQNLYKKSQEYRSKLVDENGG
ncbi:hypothetical protein [Flavobacterium piscisymbiosum]|uniref:Uncharacterized protein n=1 Tax=Flavobacterium piscisymbiosum TaxID=2893753 RepID=A0ABS8MD85_9FLAO|nr:hypothetical protein [Flavobacterium sp. F-30]MCC9063479.1 hypothetical protein [Flavobacterium sp. F-30]